MQARDRSGIHGYTSGRRRFVPHLRPCRYRCADNLHYGLRPICLAGVQGQQHRLPAQTVSGAGSAACARQAVAPVGRRSRRQTRRHRKDDLRAQRDLTNDTRAVQGQDHTRRHRLHSLFLYILRKGIAHYPLGRNLRRRQDFGDLPRHAARERVLPRQPAVHRIAQRGKGYRRMVRQPPRTQPDSRHARADNHIESACSGVQAVAGRHIRPADEHRPKPREGLCAILHRGLLSYINGRQSRLPPLDPDF